MRDNQRIVKAYVSGSIIIEEKRSHGLTHQEIRDICHFYPARFVESRLLSGDPPVEVYKFVKIKGNEHH